ncbi:MAG: tetratricopeptide repeat protein [Candidatus Aegiribacteria sp.]|nr:tetratricopeptide repeat protein [Candidatus Aegiribacteria sp.]
MSDKSDALKLLLKRFLIALPFFVVSLIMFKKGYPVSLFAVFPLALSACFMGEPLSMLITNPLGAIFFPKSSNPEINLMFSMPEARIMEGRYEEALDLLKEMIPRDPQRLEVYMRIMNLAVNRMKQPETARDVFHIGMKNIKNLRNRKILAHEYRRLMLLFRESTR